MPGSVLTFGKRHDWWARERHDAEVLSPAPACADRPERSVIPDSGLLCLQCRQPVAQIESHVGGSIRFICPECGLAGSL